MKQLALLIVLIGTVTMSHAKWGVSIASGYGAAQLVPLRIGVQRLLYEQTKPTRYWPLIAYGEVSVYTMHRHRPAVYNNPQSLKAAALAGVIRFVGGKPYIELGVGLSYLNHSRIATRDLGIHFQFEDRIGIGVRLGDKQQYDIGYKAIHFSNAYLGPANHGINLHVLSFNYWF